MNTKRGFARCEADARLDAEALRLRSSGLTYEVIALRENCDRSTAWRRVQRALAEIPRELADEYRALEGQRLDALWEIAFALALDGSLVAIDRCLTIMARRARLLGLDAPSRLSVEQPSYSAGEIVAQVERLRRIMREHDAEHDPEGCAVCNGP